MNKAKEKYCKKGDHYVPIEDFYKSPKTPDGKFYCCKECYKKVFEERKSKVSEGTIKAF